MIVSFVCPVHGRFLVASGPGESKEAFFVRITTNTKAKCPHCGATCRPCKKDRN